MNNTARNAILLFGFTLIVLFLLFPKNASAEECSLYLKFPAIPEFCRSPSGCPSPKTYCIGDSVYLKDYGCSAFFCRECTGIFMEDCDYGCADGKCKPPKPCDKITSQSECQSPYYIDACKWCDISNGCMDQSVYAEMCSPQCDDGVDNEPKNGCIDFSGGDRGCTSKDDTTEVGGCCAEKFCTPDIIRDGNCCETYCEDAITKPGECEII